MMHVFDFTVPYIFFNRVGPSFMSFRYQIFGLGTTSLTGSSMVSFKKQSQA